MTLTHCSDLAAADWITGSRCPWQQLVTFGPPVFPAHARLRFIPDPALEGQSENDAVRDAGLPSETAHLRTVLETLAPHTRTPDDCYFCLWDGWATDIEGDDGTRIVHQEDRNRADGGRLPPTYREVRPTIRQRPPIAPAFPPSVRHGPKVVVPNRAYFLFRGKVSDFGDWGAAEMWPGQPRRHMPDPAFVWPADRAWCIANDVDPHWAGIGADIEAISQLVDDPRLDVVPADPSADPPRYH